MTLKIQDTLSRQKRPFEPIHEGEARMYVCGMTVQDKPHVGHMRAAVVGDTIRRYLEFSGYKVTYVYNFTDVDDKIIARAGEEGVDYKVIAQRNMEAYLDAARKMNIRPATHYPKATEHIQEIIDLVQKLVDKGVAYASGGDVYYRVSRDHEYGKLSGRRIDELQSGARIEVGEAKEDPLDFTLWKGAKPGEPSWPSPWGNGRPGWHIECSAMSMKYLGETFDIHGGGLDLIFPHHENEIAQSESATGKLFARNWIHNGLVNLGGEKMSKSTQHFFLFVSTHYRSPIEFNRERLEEAGRAFGRLLEMRSRVEETLTDSITTISGLLRRVRDGNVEDLPEDLVGAVQNAFEAMDDDFNTARVIGQLFEISRVVNRFVDEGVSRSKEISESFGALVEMMGLLGLEWPQREAQEAPTDVLEMAKHRAEARAKKDWAEADRLRDEIHARGWTLADQGDQYILKPL
jgi:cysteinyl-tRNA synthetase